MYASNQQVVIDEADMLDDIDRIKKGIAVNENWNDKNITAAYELYEWHTGG